MKTGYKVCDAMTKRPVAVDPDTSIKDCAELMTKMHVGSLVVKKGGSLKGIITEQDIVRKIVAKGINPLNEKVKEYMVKKIITISPEKDVYDALTLMRDKNIRHIPVVDNKEMIGFLTLKDILKIEPQLFDLMVEKFELREERRKPINVISDQEGVCETCGNYSPRLMEIDGSMVCSRCS